MNLILKKRNFILKKKKYNCYLIDKKKNLKKEKYFLVF
jgi:hypothetical protein